MSVSNFIYGTAPITPTIGTLAQLGEPNQAPSFYEQNLFIQDTEDIQSRANTFIKSLEKNLDTQEGSKSPLQVFLQHIVQLSPSDETAPVFARITQAFFKQKGYFMRLFSEESWEEWTENRTALGKVAAQFRYCIQSTIELNNCVKKLDGRVIQRANEEAEALLEKLNSSTAIPMFSRIGSSFNNFNLLHQSSCVKGLIVGTVASLATKDPLPLLMGLCDCLPHAYAQQKVGSEFQVNTYTADSQKVPSVATFNNGNFVVVWQSLQQDGSNNGIYGQLFAGNAFKIGNEFQVNTYTTNSQGSPSVATFMNSNFVVVWQSWLQDGANGNGIYGQLFDASGNRIGNEFQVNTYTPLDQRLPSVTSFSNGNFVVTWDSKDQDGSGYGVVAQLFDENANKIGTEFLVNTYISGNQYASEITNLENDDFVVTWTSFGQVNVSSEVYGQLFDANCSKIGSEFQVNTYTTNNQDLPSVASLSNGNFVVTWESEEQVGFGYGIFAQLFDKNSSKTGTEFQVNTYTDDEEDLPSVAGFSNSNFIVTWTGKGQDGDKEGIYGQLFDGSGSKKGSEFQINTYINNSQTWPAVASLSNNNFIVTWFSFLQDGSGAGIYGQIFHDNITTPSTSSTTSTTTVTGTFDSSSSTRSSTTKTASSPTSDITTNAIPPSSPPNNRLLWLWVLLGITGGTTCIGITGYFFLKRGSREKDSSIELGQANFEFPYAPIEPPTPPRIISEYLSPKRTEKTHTRIGDKYELMNKISREEAKSLAEQTGINIVFPTGVNRTKVLFGKGNFGKIRLARNIKSNLFFAVKKIKGKTQIEQSKEEGTLQKKLKGKSNIMRILNFVESVDSNGEPVLYQFMPLAGFGNGEELSNHLEGLRDSVQKEQILTHVAKGLLTGLSHMHQAHIYHADMKPANMVLDIQGEVYVIDFGCAKELPSGKIQEKITGDTRYFSPERIALYRQIRDNQEPDPIAADKVDAWALGLSLLELATGEYPFDQTSFSEKVLRWNNAYFEQKLDAIPSLKDPEPDSIMTVVKGLLEVDPQKRLSIEEALDQLAHTEPFSSISEQQATFADLKQQETSSPSSHVPHLPRDQDENYEHVFAQRYGYKLTPDSAPPTGDGSVDYSEPLPQLVDSGYTNPIPRRGDTSHYTNPSPPPYE